MPRTGGIYTPPAGTKGIPLTTILSSTFNAYVDDITADANAARPITAGGTGATSASGARTALGLEIGSDVQAQDPGLTSIAGLTTTANQMLYTTAADAYATTALTPFARTILDDIDAAAARATLGLVPGTNVQAYDAGLQSIAGLTTAANQMLYTTAPDVYATTALTPFARTVLDDANAAAVLSTLGVSAFAQTVLDDPDAATVRATTGTNNASNMTLGTLADARLPATMSAKTFATELFINQPTNGANSHLWFQNQGVNRGLIYYAGGGEELVLQLHNAAGAYVRSAAFRQSDGRFYVTGFVHSEGGVAIGGAGTSIYTDGNIKFSGTMATNFGSTLDAALNARIKNDGGTYGVNITGNAATATRAYPRKADGGNINFNWSGQSGSPTWVWGGSDGTNMYVYSPSNFNVSWANNAGNSDTVDGYHDWQFMKAPSTSTNNTETNFPIGHTVMAVGYHVRNGVANVFNDGGDVNRYTISGGTGGAMLAGTWLMRGSHTGIAGGLSNVQRTA